MPIHAHNLKSILVHAIPPTYLPEKSQQTSIPISSVWNSFNWVLRLYEQLSQLSQHLFQQLSQVLIQINCCTAKRSQEARAQRSGDLRRSPSKKSPRVPGEGTYWRLPPTVRFGFKRTRESVSNDDIVKKQYRNKSIEYMCIYIYTYNVIYGI